MEQLGSVVATDVPCSVIGTSSKILGTLDDNNAAARWWLERVDWLMLLLLLPKK